jgi:hypothetical protein
MGSHANKKRWSKWFNRGTVLGLITGSIIALVTAQWTLTWWLASDLTAGISGGTWEQLTAEFDARLERRFPVGTRRFEVTDALQAQGFTPSWHPPSTGEFMATRDECNFVCRIQAEVYWRVTADNKLGSIRGVYHERGCL